MEGSKLRLVELFAGIGAQAQALEQLGIEYESTVCEIDRKAYASYCAIHGDAPNLGDITEVEHLPDCDLLTWSFPCIRGDQRVQTKRGLVPMKDVVVGDEVFTHEGRFMPVTAHKMTGIHGTVKVRAMGRELVCTHDHMVYTRYNLGNNSHAGEDGTTKRRFTQPYWAPAVSLTEKNYVGLPVYSEGEELPSWDGKLRERFWDEDFWWVCGRYLADGWIRTQGGIVIAVGKDKEKDIERIQKVFNVSIAEERTATKVHIPIKELGEFCDTMMGHGAMDKHIAPEMLRLNSSLLRQFIEGYLSGDGCVAKNGHSVTTVSPDLALDLATAVAKAYRRHCTISRCEREPTCEIEGRTVNQHDTYTIRWSDEERKQDKAFCEDWMIWMPVSSVEVLNPTQVYDISVEEDQSFVVEGMVVHNCQDLSIAGNKAGMAEGSGTRSSLAWEVVRLLRDAEERKSLPRRLVMENVPAILFKKNKPEFDRICRALEALGYTNSYAIMNAKDYGTPQNRNRCFMVSSLDGMRFRFPEPCPDGRVLRDVLEKDVDEALYFSDEKIARYEEHRVRHREAGHGFGWEPTHGEGIGKSVTCNPDRHSGNFIIVTGDLHLPGNIESTNRVYGKDGIAPTLPTGAGGGHIPRIKDSIAYPSGTKRGYMEAYEGDGLVVSRTHKARGTVQSQSTPTLTTGTGCGTGAVVADGEKLRIRYLSPRECWRLMGFTDEAYDRAKAIGTSKTQLYKQAGNSIAVPCLKAIFKGMFLEDSWEHEGKRTLDDYME